MNVLRFLVFLVVGPFVAAGVAVYVFFVALLVWIEILSLIGVED